MNFVIIMGRVTADIELRTTTSGKSVTNFNLAVDRPFAKDTTDFFECVAWDKTAETISKYVGKGRKIAIRGSIQNRTWTDKQGNKRISTEVVVQEFFFCESKQSDSTNTSPTHNVPSQSEFMPSAYVGTLPVGFEDVSADQDLPF